MNIKNLTVRAGSGIIYIAVIVAATLLEQPWFSILVGILAITASLEYSKIVRGINLNTAAVTVVDTALATMVALLTAGGMETLFVRSVIVFLLLMCRAVMTLYDRSQTPIKSLAYSVLLYVYIGIPLMMLNLLESGDFRIVLVMFCALWINDTGAYLVGSLCGRHKLYERISPKKTWEGFFGGIGLNIIAAVVAGLLLPEGEIMSRCCMHTVPYLILIAVSVSVFGTWGDLLESLLKRTMHIKDSGNIIPGHGGILDRIDSLLLAAPVVMFLYLLI